ncbi:MAG: hypothetical protein K0Q68_105 [Moraxellaceae bacterium]|nr:hypothetical protein [Moraxellaceae bacterium]
MGPAVSTLPPPGHWALGADTQAHAERLVAQAQREGLRTGWLASEAGFLSNLNIIENLRLLHDWYSDDGAAFEVALSKAVAQLPVPATDWLQARPSQLGAATLLQARCLRLLLLRPDFVVLHPACLAQAGPGLADQLVAGLAGARLLLLAEPMPDWPAWPPARPTGPAASSAADEDTVV